MTKKEAIRFEKEQEYMDYYNFFLCDIHPDDPEEDGYIAWVPLQEYPYQRMRDIEVGLAHVGEFMHFDIDWDYPLNKALEVYECEKRHLAQDRAIDNKHKKED